MKNLNQYGGGSSNSNDDVTVIGKKNDDVTAAKLASTINGYLHGNIRRSTVQTVGYECCIFRVPKRLREEKKDAYTPRVVSIGPYHLQDDRLRYMEPYKIKHLGSLFGQPEGVCEPHPRLQECMDMLVQQEDLIRASYADPINLSKEDFLQMVLIDSVFIVRFLNIFNITAQGESAFERVCVLDIKRDLLLLENQLPFFILEQIYNICYPTGTSLEASHSFEYLVAKFFDLTFDRQISHRDNRGHFLDFVRNQYVGAFKSIRNGKGGLQYKESPTVTRLHTAGVKLQVAHTSFSFNFVDSGGQNYGQSDEEEKEQNYLRRIKSHIQRIPRRRRVSSLLAISFDKERGILTIPKLIAKDSNQSLFRNIIALEQCMYHSEKPTYITDYFNFLDCLINTPKDVQLLADKGIVDNWLGSDLVCDMFNTISNNTQIVSWEYAYSGLSEDLNKHCKNSWNNYKALFRYTYLAQPWAVISLVAAIFLLLLTIAQVILAILALPGVL